MIFYRIDPSPELGDYSLDNLILINGDLYKFPIIIYPIPICKIIILNQIGKLVAGL